MKKYKIMLACCLVMMFSMLNTTAVFAERDSFQNQLMDIEERSKLLNLVIKKLTSTYKKAKKQHEFLEKAGMPAADIQRVEDAFKRKIKGMINDTLAQIEEI